MDRAVRYGVGIAGAAVAAMMVIGMADIALTATKFPVPGAIELMEMLMVLVVFLALPEIELKRGHIAIDLIAVRMPIGVRALFARIGYVLGLAFYALMAWQAWKLFWNSWTIREYAAGLVQFPVYPTKGLFAIGVTLVAMAAAINLVRSLLARDAEVATATRAAAVEKKVL